MKKIYQKPEIEYVSLSLSDPIAVDGDVESIPGITIPDEEEED